MPQQHDPKVVEREVRGMFEAYADALHSEGLKGEFTFLDTTEAFFWVPPGARTAWKRDSIRAVVAEAAKGSRSMDFRMTDLRIVVLNDSAAVYTSNIEVTDYRTNGDTSLQHLVETGVVVKRRSGWKLLCGQTAGTED